jgi:tetratricopeptide (TPR) repeat protein/tRNA A-37 threonylcarbamoyl transferase component Bud32
MTCPDLGHLIDLLEERLEGEDATGIEAHIEDCPECQVRLDRLTDSRTGLAGYLSVPEAGTNQAVRGGPDQTTARARRRDSSGSLPQTEADAENGPIPPPEDLGSTRSFHFDPGSRESFIVAAPSATSPAIPGYQVEAELGHGGMGVVYRARHLGLKRRVALKMIRDGGIARPDQRERFLREAQIVAHLRHPNIVQIFDIGESAGLLYVALELLEGGTLADRIDGTPQPPTAAAPLLVVLAEAIEAAHQEGVIHRDLKPSNILFDGAGTPKVADFGLAKRLDPDEAGQTASGQILGSPSYMAPEQADGKTRETTPAADVYALGAILYEMLTGRPPFKGESAMDTIRLVLEADLVPPSRLNPRIPRDLETICLACLQKSPARRYPAATRLADDLRRFLTGRPVWARRTPPWERGWKWCRRNKVAATLLALGTLGTLGGAAAGVWHNGRLRAAEVAEQARVSKERGRLGGMLDEAQDHVAGARWGEARVILSEIRPQLEPRREPRLGDLRHRMDILLKRVQAGEDAEEERAASVGELGRFREARVQALFSDFTDVGYEPDPVAGLRATRSEARRALGLFADPARPPGSGWTMPRVPGRLTPEERAEVRDGCYELLLVLAGATAQALPGEAPEAQAAAALAILDDATTLGRSSRAQHLHRAFCLDRLGRRDEAAAERRAAERAEPADAFDHFLSGRERFARADLPGALNHFEASLRLDPGHFWAHALTAAALLQMRRPGEARAHLDVCLQSRGDSPLLYRLRGDAAGEAAAQLKERAAAQPGGSKALLSDAAALSDAAEADYARALESLTTNAGRYALLVNRGVLRYRRGDLEDAAADCDAARALDPDAFQAYAMQSEICRRRGDIEQAETLLTLAIERAEGRPELYRARALLVKEIPSPTPGRLAAALADLERSASLERPGSPRAARDRAERAVLLFGAGRYEDARSAAGAALKDDPNSVEGHRVLIASLLELGRHDALLSACDAALEHGAEESEIYEMRGLARIALRDFSGAVQDYTHAMGVRPRSAALLGRRGWAYLFANAPQLALPDFDRAVAIDPNHGDARSGRSFVYVLMGRDRDALTEAEAAVRVAGDQPRVLYQAARTYAVALGRAEAAASGRASAHLAARWSRPVALLKQALERSTADQREVLTREITNDTALGPLRRRMDLKRSLSAPSRPVALSGARPGTNP